MDQLAERLTSDPKVPGSIPGQVSWKFGQKNFYRGRILIHGFPEPLGTKYHGLDTPVLGFQLFAEIHFGGVWGGIGIDTQIVQEYFWLI